jgi:hypothetical protein
MPLSVRRPDRKGRSAIVTRERVLGAKPTGVGCFADNLCRAQRPAAHNSQQRRSDRGDPDGDLGGEFVDLVGQQPQVLHQPQRQSTDNGAVVMAAQERLNLVKCAASLQLCR